jgi:hypothetical protein
MHHALAPLCESTLAALVGGAPSDAAVDGDAADAHDVSSSVDDRDMSDGHPSCGHVSESGVTAEVVAASASASASAPSSSSSSQSLSYTEEEASPPLSAAPQLSRDAQMVVGGERVEESIAGVESDDAAPAVLPVPLPTTAADLRAQPPTLAAGAAVTNAAVPFDADASPNAPHAITSSAHSDAGSSARTSHESSLLAPATEVDPTDDDSTELVTAPLCGAGSSLAAATLTTATPHLTEDAPVDEVALVNVAFGATSAPAQGDALGATAVPVAAIDVTSAPAATAATVAMCPPPKEDSLGATAAPVAVTGATCAPAQDGSLGAAAAPVLTTLVDSASSPAPTMLPSVGQEHASATAPASMEDDAAGQEGIGPTTAPYTEAQEEDISNERMPTASSEPDGVAVLGERKRSVARTTKHVRAHTRTHAHTHTRTHAHTHSHTHTHTHTHNPHRRCQNRSSQSSDSVANRTGERRIE